MRFGIEHWWVWVEDKGAIKKYSVWAGLQTPSKDSVLWDLKCKISGDDPFEENVITRVNEIQGLVGSDIESYKGL